MSSTGSETKSHRFDSPRQTFIGSIENVLTNTNKPPTDLNISFEFFPPKTAEMEATLWNSVKTLAPFNPKFVSVTYGAGGTTRQRTHEIVTSIQKNIGLDAAAHLTCVGATREEIDQIARSYWEAGIKHIVALRGDAPQNGESRDISPGASYSYASDLVAGLKKVAPFEISVACYPEVHPEAQDAATDLDNLKRKIDAGADRAITQFFLETDSFLRFRDKASAAGISVPFVAGILPITNFQKTVEFAGRCGAKVPGWMAALFEGLDDLPTTRQLVAATVAVQQCCSLYTEGVKDLHFYTLNRADLSYAICHMLGMRPSATVQQHIENSSQDKSYDQSNQPRISPNRS